METGRAYEVKTAGVRIAKIMAFYAVLLSVICFMRVDTQAATYTTIKVSSSDIKSEGAAKAIQTALDKAKKKATSSKPYKVVVPSGSYTLTSSLNIYSNTYLYAKDCTFKLKSGKDSNMIKVGDDDDTKATGYYYKNITIYGGTWNGNGNDSTVLKIGHAYNVVVKNATFKNVKDAHLCEVAGVKKLTIKNCIFKDQTLSSKTETSVSMNEAIQIDILVSRHFKGYLSEDLANKSITITGCTFSNVPRGIGSHTGVVNNPTNGLTITNNTFKNLTSCGIQLMAVKNCTISGNTMTSVPRGIYIYSYNLAKAYYTYTGSVLKKEDGKGSATSSSYKTPANSNIVISDNTITMKGTDQYADYVNAGIWLQGTKLTSNKKWKSGTIKKGNYYLNGVTVTGNTITTTGHGIRMSDVYNSTISDNTITGPSSSSSSYYGISSLNASKKNTISGNTIKKFYRGVYIYGSSTVSSVVSNSMSSIGNNGIMISNATVTKVKENTISSAKANGIYVSGSASVSYIKSNTIKTPTKDGIRVENSTVKYIQLNTITSSGNHGIYLSSAVSTKISSNSITDPASNGIRVDSSETTSILSNTISGAGGNGIYLGNSTCSTISYNTLASINGTAIKLYNTTVETQSDNTVQ